MFRSISPHPIQALEVLRVFGTGLRLPMPWLAVDGESNASYNAVTLRRYGRNADLAAFRRKLEAEMTPQLSLF